MKITFVLDCFEGGGKERRCLQLIQGLNKAGYNDIQVIIVNNDIAYKELYDTNIKLHIVDRKNKKLNYLQTCLYIYRLLKKFKPDIVQVWGVFSTFFTNPIRCFQSFKYIGSYVADCNKPNYFSAEKVTIYINNILSDYIIGNSKAGLKAYDISSKKGRVIYNGFNESRYNDDGLRKVELKKKLQVNAVNVVSMIARLDNHKDHKTFIESAKIILKDRNDIDFLIIGKGENLMELKSLISKKESNHIHFLGFRTDVEDIIKISDITVLCTNSFEHKEGVSNAILESCAFGVPVIATNDGGTPEIIESGINGFLIDEFDFFDLKNRILEILDNEDLKLKLSNNAMCIVEKKFTLKAMTKEYINIYKECLN